MDRNDVYESMVNDMDKSKLNATTRGQLSFLIGLPRSGKSTYAFKWSRSGYDIPRVVVRADDIRIAVTGQRFNSRTEPTVHMIKDYMIESLLIGGNHVLVDGTHTTKTSIRRLLQMDPQATYHIIHTPAEICKERAVACGQSDLVPIIDRMGRQLQSLIDVGVSQICEEIRQEINGYGQHRSV